MGKRIKSLMATAEAAGYAMAADDIYAEPEHPVAMEETAPVQSTALVALPSQSAHLKTASPLKAQLRSTLSRYANPAWLLPRRMPV